MKKLFILMLVFAMFLQLMAVNLYTAFAYSSGDVVINEIAWAGSIDNSNDEWIELYNNTTQTIDLAGWIIEDDSTTVYTIESGFIEPHGYFLIEDQEGAVNNVSADSIIGLSLANTGDSLVLKDASGTIVDSVNTTGGAWYAGDSVLKATMERIDPSVTIDSIDNWATAISSNGSVGQLGTEILGTPGTVNSNYAGSGTIVSVTPENIFASNGDQITFTVNVEAATDLFSYGFDILYDPTVLTFVAATEGDFLNSDGAATAFNAALEDGNAGKLVVGNARLVNPVSGIDGNGNLFSLTFDVAGTAGESTEIILGASSFLADSVGDFPAAMKNASFTVESDTVSEVTGLNIIEGINRYSLDISWDENLSGVDTYVVKKLMPDGEYYLLNEISDNFYTDDNSIVPYVSYTYQIIPRNNGLDGTAVEITGMETRGLQGDLDRSDRVDGRDIEKLARSYGKLFGEAEYDLQNDSNFDGFVDGSDLIDIGANFGLTYS